MVNDGYKSRKFTIAAGSLTVASIFVAIGKLTGGEWVTVTTLVLAIYGAANVKEKEK